MPEDPCPVVEDLITVPEAAHRIGIHPYALQARADRSVPAVDQVLGASGGSRCRSSRGTCMASSRREIATQTRMLAGPGQVPTDRQSTTPSGDRSSRVFGDNGTRRPALPAGRPWPPPGAIVRVATDAELVEALEYSHGHRRGLEPRCDVGHRRALLARRAPGLFRRNRGGAVSVAVMTWVGITPRSKVPGGWCCSPWRTTPMTRLGRAGRRYGGSRRRHGSQSDRFDVSSSSSRKQRSIEVQADAGSLGKASNKRQRTNRYTIVHDPGHSVRDDTASGMTQRQVDPGTQCQGYP